MNSDTLMAIFMLIFQVLGQIYIHLFLIVCVHEAAVRVRTTRGKGAAALCIKLHLGLKLCKLPGRFQASVNKVNYSVNYNFFARSQVGPQALFCDCSSLDSRFYTQLFSSNIPPSLPFTSSFAMAALPVTLVSFIHQMGMSARISASSSQHKSIPSSASTGSTALDKGRAEPKSTSSDSLQFCFPPASSWPSSLSMGQSNRSMLENWIVSYGWRGWVSSMTKKRCAPLVSFGQNRRL